MLQIVTLRDDYLYQTAHFCIINLTDSTAQFCGITYFMVKTADNKIAD